METTRVKHGTTERIFATVSDSSGSPVSGLADVLLEMYRKSDGKYFDFNDTTFKSSGWTTRQGAMTELSAAYSPGVYYYDFNTTDHSSQFVEESYLMTVTSATAANDPLYGELKVGGFVDQIGMVGGVVSYGKGKGMTDGQIKKLAETVWSYVLKNEKTAEETLLSKSEFNAAVDKVLVDQTELKTAIEKIPQLEDRTDEVLAAVERIEKPKDLTKDIQAVGKKVEGLVSDVKPMVKEFSDMVSTFESKMNVATNEINSSLDQVAQISKGFTELQEAMSKYGDKLGEQTDMDRRMAQFMNKFQEKDLELINERLKSMMRMITDVKYDILKELK